MTDQIADAGTTQNTGASQAAAPAAPATLLDGGAPSAQAAQPQAPEGKEPAPADAGKPAEQAGKPADGNGAKPEGDAPQGAPEKYEFKPVEGVQLSEEVTAKFSEVAKELNLPQDAAQKMLDQVAPAIAKQQIDALQKMDAEWVAQVKADKEIGGEKLDANLAIARKAIDAFGTDGLRKLLNESRLANNPEVIRFLVRAGQAINEDKHVPGGTRPNSGGRDPATILYGKQS